MKQVNLFVLSFILTCCKKHDASIIPPPEETTSLAFYTSDWQLDGRDSYFTVDNGNQQYPVVYRDLMKPPDCSDTALPRITTIPYHFYSISIYIRNNRNTEPKYDLYKRIGFQNLFPGCNAYDLYHW